MSTRIFFQGSYSFTIQRGAQWRSTLCFGTIYWNAGPFWGNGLAGAVSLLNQYRIKDNVQRGDRRDRREDKLTTELTETNGGHGFKVISLRFWFESVSFVVLICV